MWKSFLISCFFSTLYFSLFGQSKNRLEAVCILGSAVDIDYEERIEEIAALLESRNFKVHRFYDPNNDWESIKKAAVNCTFFVYSGHGTTAGLDGGFGGMVIKDFVPAWKIKDELIFNNQPVVVYLNACGSAGSSGDDIGDIGAVEAQKRIVGTATPFLLIGAKAFYANNYFGGSEMFINYMLDGMNINDAFVKTLYSSLKTIKNQPIQDKRLSSIYNIAYTSDKIYDKTKKEKRGYDIAYVGIPTFKLNEVAILSKK